MRGNFFMDSIKDFYFQLTVSGILTDWIFRALCSFVFDEKHVFQISNCILSDLFYLCYRNAEIYIQSAPNNSNETYISMALGRAGRFGQS